MGDRVEAFEIDRRQLPYVAVDCRDPAVFVSSKGAVLIEFRVDAHDFMTGRHQPVDEGAADIAPMPGY
jgi:hypothetical protein